MGLLECAGGASIWKGYDYFRKKKVVHIEEIGQNIFSATVGGGSEKLYSVELHIDHPRKSKCSCPHADGRRIICKHIVAAYFSAFPAEAEKFYIDALAEQEKEEQRQAELSDRVIAYVCKMKKSELQQALLQTLFDGPEWQYMRFIEDHFIEND